MVRNNHYNQSICRWPVHDCVGVCECEPVHDPVWGRVWELTCEPTYMSLCFWYHTHLVIHGSSSGLIREVCGINLVD